MIMGISHARTFFDASFNDIYRSRQGHGDAFDLILETIIDLFDQSAEISKTFLRSQSITLFADTDCIFNDRIFGFGSSDIESQQFHDLIPRFLFIISSPFIKKDGLSSTFQVSLSDQTLTDRQRK